MFQLNSQITIGNFKFSGVHEVHIKRSIHSYVDTAVIRLPAKGQVNKNGKVQETIVGKNFTDGDPVTIGLGYNGNIITEFKGFVTSRDLDIPLQLTCEGYSYQLKRNNVSGSWKSISVADLLNKAVAGTEISKVVCTTDIVLTNIHFENATGATIIDQIMKETDNNLSIFFISPDTLWCGVVYTPYAFGNDIFQKGFVKYRLGYNVHRENSLKQRLPQDDPGTHTYYKKTTSGTKLEGKSTDIPGAVRAYKRTLNYVADEPSLQVLAQEHQYRENYIGYEGSLRAFLQPYCLPGYMAWVADSNYPERDGTYMVEGTTVTFGTSGARRKVDIGPRLTGQ